MIHADVPDKYIPKYMVLLEASSGETSLMAFMSEEEMEEWLKESTWKVLHTYEWNVESASWWDVDWED